MELLFKIMGSVFVVAGSGYMAASINRTMEQRVIELRRMYSILLQLKSEMQYMGNTLPESFHRLSECTVPPLSLWLLRLTTRLEKDEGLVFREIWCDELQNLYEESSFEQADLELLRELADKLGNADVTTQIKAIDYVLLQVEQKRKELCGEIKEKKKVVASLSLFAGMLTLILLL